MPMAGRRQMRGLAALGLLAILAACSSTGTQGVTTDSRSGTVNSVGGTITIGTYFDTRLLGRWTLSDRFAHSCTYTFEDEVLPGTSSTGKAVPTGYCTSPFDEVEGWRSAGRSIILTDGAGDRIVSLSPDGTGTYRGQYRSRAINIEVRLRRGSF